jgi:adenylate cyclase
MHNNPFGGANARLVLYFTVIGAVGGAVYGDVDAAAIGEDSVHGAVRGILTGAMISSTLSSLETYLLGGARDVLFRSAPFLVHFAVRSMIYLVVILLGLAAGAWFATLIFDSTGSLRIERHDVLFSLAFSIAMNFLFAVNRLLGQNVLLNFVAGRYHSPQIEDRVLLFIDMDGSTGTAERLGEVGFLIFLNRFLTDVTGPIVAQGGEIHKYVGDELIVTWKLAAGIRDARCIRACFGALARLDERASTYEREFGTRANFRAGLHCGPVVIGELGTIKQEIAFLGDSMNTAARLQQACRDTGQRVLASADLVDRIAALPVGIAKRSLGSIQLRGKTSTIEVYALDAVGSAERASRRAEPVDVTAVPSASL